MQYEGVTVTIKYLQIRKIAVQEIQKNIPKVHRCPQDVGVMERE